MEPTGSPQNSPSDYVSIELYGGPLDGALHAVPKNYISSLGAIRIIVPCNNAELKKFADELGISLFAGQNCDHLYVHRPFDNRYVYRSTQLQ